MTNLINPEAIDRYLAGFFPDDPVAARHLQTAPRPALKKADAAVQPVPSLPDDAPEWLNAEWPQGGPYHRFAPDPAPTRRVKHVTSYSCSMIIVGESNRIP